MPLGNLAPEHRAHVIGALRPGECLADRLGSQGLEFLPDVALKRFQIALEFSEE